jgi:hypothetical protein
MHIAREHNNSAAYRIALDDFTGARESGREGLCFALRARGELQIATALQHIALLAGLGGEPWLGARLLGYVNAQFATLGYAREPTEQWSYDKLMDALRETLSADEIARLAADGAAWSEDQAVEGALR